MSLNLNKIISFERNYLREMILALDYKVIFLYDLNNPNNIRSLKANNNEVFTNACFASNNRFVVLAVKVKISINKEHINKDIVNYESCTNSQPYFTLHRIES